MADDGGQDRVVGDEERARALLEQLKSVHALDVGRDMVIAAVNYSYPKLGLNDETRPVRDLDDVRLSIELVRAILEVLDRDHSSRTADLHDTLAQMQLAYAHAVQLANAERAAEHEPVPARPEAAAGEPAEAAAAEKAPAAEEAPEVAESEAAGQEPAARRPAAGTTRKKAAAKKPAAGKATPKKTAAKKKPAPRKKPAGES